jgi:hypothetical protein
VGAGITATNSGSNVTVTVTATGTGGSGTIFVSNLLSFTRTFTGTGTASSYDLQANIAGQDQLVVHVDGIYQVPGTNFTANTGHIIFSSPPSANSEIIVQHAITSSNVTGVGSASVTVSTSAPNDSSEGDLWLDSDNAKLAVYFANSWVEVGGSSSLFTANDFITVSGIDSAGNIRAANFIANSGIYSDNYYFANGAPFANTGPQGATGATGAQGSTGATGVAGAAGSTGATGLSGSDGATGATGAAGVNGATGATGAAGANGSTGATGAEGATGATGIGATGATGIAGNIGATGPQGATGVQANLTAVASDIIPASNVTYDLGTSSQRWRDLYLSGNSIYLGQAQITSAGNAVVLPAGSYIGNVQIGTGSGGGASITVADSAPAGTEGALWFNTNLGELLVYYANVWLQPIGGIGPQGNIGATGATGPVGATGFGATGATGPQGATGPAGGGAANIIISDEGNVLTTAVTSINFVGAGITASNVGSNITVTVTATGSGSGNTYNTIYNISNASVGFGTPVINDTFTANGSQTQFTLSANVNAATDLLVTVDTVLQRPGTNYTLSGNILTFLAAPSASSVIGVRTFGNYSSSAGFVDRFTGNGVQTAYTLSGATLSSTSMVVFVDGIYQIPDVDFTLSGTTLTFIGANAVPDANSEIVVQSFNNTLRDNVTVASIVADAVSPTSVNTAPVAIDSFGADVYRTAKYVISVTGNASYQATEAMLVHNGTTAQLVTYATVYTGANVLMTFDANIVSNTVTLWGTGVSSGNTVKLQKTYVKV